MFKDLPVPYCSGVQAHGGYFRRETMENVEDLGAEFGGTEFIQALFDYLKTFKCCSVH